ncbi:MAG: hypothetical protein AAFN77_15620 [Planctomycetota bacterium]
MKSLLDVNLLDAVDGKLLERFISDPVLLCDVLYAICKPEADTKNIPDEEFGRAMAGDAIDAGTTALLEELVDFFPSGKRQVLSKALAKLKTFENKALEAASQRLDDPELEKRMEEAIKNIELPETTLGG